MNTELNVTSSESEGADVKNSLEVFDIIFIFEIKDINEYLFKLRIARSSKEKLKKNEMNFKLQSVDIMMIHNPIKGVRMKMRDHTELSKLDYGIYLKVVHSQSYSIVLSYYFGSSFKGSTICSATGLETGTEVKHEIQDSRIQNYQYLFLDTFDSSSKSIKEINVKKS